MKPSHVSRLTTNRLSVYLRCLNTLEQAGIKTVSSRELAEQFHLNSAQIRKDLANFGEFGVRGVGYDVPLLKQHLIRILGLNKPYNIIIAGAGNLGLALAAYGGFNSGGLRDQGAVRLEPREGRLPRRGGLSRVPDERDEEDREEGKGSISPSLPCPRARARQCSITSRPRACGRF